MQTKKPNESSQKRIKEIKTKALTFAALLFEKTAKSMDFMSDLLKEKISIEIKVIKNKKEKEVK